MSNDRAIAAVTATLRALLFRSVTTVPDLNSPQVTARPPDRARAAVPGNLINLFLYQTSLDAAWRNQPMPPARSGDGGRPPLPLKLSYLVTAYGDNDDEVISHRLLGVAMSVLHSRPVLTAADIAVALPGSGLEYQVERVKITPYPVPLDEVSRMWATFQTGYRISVSYEASVVLIDDLTAAEAALPVLAVGKGDVGPTVVPQLPPVLEFAGAPGDQLGVRPGEGVTLSGRGLGGVTHVVFNGPHLPETRLAPSSVGVDRVVVTVPGQQSGQQLLPAGTAMVTALVEPPGGQVLASNGVPVGLVPTLAEPLPLAADLVNQAATVTVSCVPPVAAGQTVALIVGERVVPGQRAATARSQIDFALTGFTAGTYPVRLDVDGWRSIPIAGQDNAAGGGQPPAAVAADLGPVAAAGAQGAPGVGDVPQESLFDPRQVVELRDAP